jgi:Protein of unknown function (DUF2721)
MDPQTNPLAVLSLIVAPAVLTNASSVLAMSTTNRLARAVDRARELARQLEETNDISSTQAARRLRELASTERRSLMLLAALRSIYFALGSFACAALFSLLGSALLSVNASTIAQGFELVGIATGLLALAALVHGSAMLVQETRIVVQVLQERAASVRARVAPVREQASGR